MISTNSEKVTLTLQEVRQLLGIGRAAVYAAAKRGDLPILRVGKRIFVPRAAFEKMMASAEGGRKRPL